MAHLTSSVEYALHCLLWLAVAEGTPLSSRDLAELQGVSAPFLAKILPRLEKAGIVAASSGLRGGYRLARPPERISVLAVVDAIEGEKVLFDCQEIRARCALFDAAPPRWATQGVCAIHAVMLKAEKAMRDTLAVESLADIAGRFGRKAPPAFEGDVQAWLAHRHRARGARRGRRSGQSGA